MPWTVTCEHCGHSWTTSRRAIWLTCIKCEGPVRNRTDIYKSAVMRRRQANIPSTPDGPSLRKFKHRCKHYEI